MLAIVGKTAGPNMADIFKATPGYPGDNIG